MRKCGLIFILSILISCELFSQDLPSTELPLVEQLALAKNAEEKVDILNKLSREFARKDLAKAVNYAENALHIADSIQYKAGIALAIARKARAISFQGDNENGFSLYNDAIEKFKVLGDIDNHADALNDIGTIFLNTSQFDSAKIYFQKGYELAAKVDNDFVQANSLGNLANIQNYQGEYDDALVSYEACLHKMEAIGNTRGMSICNGNMGVIYERQGIYLEALKHYQEAQRIDEERKDSLGLAYGLNNIGVVFRNISQFERAREAFEKALGLAQMAQDKRILSYTVGNLAVNHRLKGNLDQALEFQQTHLSLAKEISEGVEEAAALSEIGLIYKEKGDLEKAKNFLQESKSICELTKDFNLLAQIQVQLAEIAFSKGDIVLAEKRAQEALSIETMKDNIRIQNGIADILTKIYEEKGQIKSALKWQKILRTTGDSLINAEKVKELAGLDYQYQFEREKIANETEKQKLAEENKAKEEELVRQRRNSFLLLIFLIIFIVLLTITIRLNSNIGKKNQQLEELSSKLVQSNQNLNKQNTEQKRAIDMLEVFAESAAHDLKAPLRIAGSYSSLLRKKHKNVWSEQEEGFWEVIMKNIKTLSKQIDDLLSISKIGQNLPEATAVEIEPVIDAVKEVYIEQIQAKNAQILVSSYLPMINGHESLVHRLFQNLISNSLKFSDPERLPVIEINGTPTEKGWFAYEIKDNGLGIAEKDQVKIFALFNRVRKDNGYNVEGTGIGLATCRKIVKHYGGKIWVESKEGEGTSMFFELPIISRLYSK